MAQGCSEIPRVSRVAFASNYVPSDPAITGSEGLTNRVFLEPGPLGQWVRTVLLSRPAVRLALISVAVPVWVYYEAHLASRPLLGVVDVRKVGVMGAPERIPIPDSAEYHQLPLMFSDSVEIGLVNLSELVAPGDTLARNDGDRICSHTRVGHRSRKKLNCLDWHRGYAGFNYCSWCSAGVNDRAGDLRLMAWSEISKFVEGSDGGCPSGC